MEQDTMLSSVLGLWKAGIDGISLIVSDFGLKNVLISGNFGKFRRPEHISCGGEMRGSGVAFFGMPCRASFLLLKIRRI